MKYIYIAGLEHSGTTLINHLLAQHQNAIGLGEVISYFDAEYVKQYMENGISIQMCGCVPVAGAGMNVTSGVK